MVSTRSQPERVYESGSSAGTANGNPYHGHVLMVQAPAPTRESRVRALRGTGMDDFDGLGGPELAEK